MRNKIQIILASLLIVFMVLACSQFSFPPETPASPAAITAVIVTEESAGEKADAGSPGLGDSLYPDFGNGGYDVKHYA